MKRCSVSLVREKQVKTTVRHHFTSTRVTVIEKTDSNKYWWRCGGTGTLTHCYWDCKMMEPFGKQFISSSKVRHSVTTWHSNSTSRETKTYISTNTCTWSVHSGIIHHSQKVEITHKSTDWLLDKQSTLGLHAAVLLLQVSPTLCKPTDCSPSGYSVRGILQARILEWAAMPSFRGSSRPRDQTHISCIGRQVLSLPPPGKSQNVLFLYNILGDKEKWSVDSWYNMDDPRKHYTKWK